jgi:hypothetical protein
MMSTYEYEWIDDTDKQKNITVIKAWFYVSNWQARKACVECNVGK